MKKENQFDSFIKEKIGEWETPVPDRVWDAILLNKEKKKRAAFWWRFRMALVFIMGVAITMIVYFVNQENATPKPIASQAQEFEKSSSNSRAQLGENHVIEKSLATKSIPSQKNDVPYSKTTETQFQTESLSSQKDITEPAKKETEHVDLIEDINKYSSIKKYKTSSSFRSKQKMGEVDEMIEVETSKKTYTNQQVSKSGIIDEEELLLLTRNVEVIAGKQKKNELDFSRLLLSQPIFIKKKDPIPCPDSDSRSKKSNLEIYTGTDFVLRQFSDTPNSLYLLKRKETQKVKSAFQFGIRYNKPIGGGFSLSGGLQYNQINEQFRHTQGNIISYTYVIDGIGDTLQTIQTISTRYKQIANRYRMLELPLMLGYEISFNNIFVRINAGAQFNLLSSYKGEVLDDQFVPISIGSKAPANKFQLNHTLGVSYVGSIGFYYEITGNKKIFIEPHFQYRTKTVTSEQLGLKQKDNIWGIRAGLRIPLSF